MIKTLSLVTLLTFSLLGNEIPIKHTQKRALSKSVALNSQVIQLSNASQVVTSFVSGHLEKYFVTSAQTVKSGQKIALIKSIEVSKMTANFLALKNQYKAQMKNYNAVRKLYKDGMTSLSKLNEESIKKDILLSNINALKAQLQTLNIDVVKLKNATPNFVLYAHSGGIVSELLQPLHSVIKEDEAIISIVKNQAFYIKSFLPLSYANLVKIGQKLVVEYGDTKIVTHVTQILPAVDAKTQRVIILSSVDKQSSNLFINTYVSSQLFFGKTEEYVTVEKSALSFFKGEWVVFTPKHHDEDEHEEHNDEADEHEEENEHHDEESETPYEVRVVEILAEDELFVAINGLELGEEYVSDKSYYVKSMLLKSSLGGHGH